MPGVWRPGKRLPLQRHDLRRLQGLLQVSIHACTHTHTHTHTYTRAHSHSHALSYTHSHTGTPTHALSHMHSHTHAHTHTHTYTHTHSHTRTLTHADTPLMRLMQKISKVDPQTSFKAQFSYYSFNQQSMHNPLYKSQL